MKAVITAGGRVDADYARAAGTDVKALAPVRGQTMIARAIEALRGAGVTRIAIVGGDEVATACAALVERIVPEGASGSDNVLRALQAWPDDDGEALLYATSDMPYVTANAVSDFVARVPAGRVALALTQYDDFAARFPDTTGFGITLMANASSTADYFLCRPAVARGRIACNAVIRGAQTTVAHGNAGEPGAGRAASGGTPGNRTHRRSRTQARRRPGRRRSPVRARTGVRRRHRNGVCVCVPAKLIRFAWRCFGLAFRRCGERCSEFLCSREPSNSYRRVR